MTKFLDVPSSCATCKNLEFKGIDMGYRSQKFLGTVIHIVRSLDASLRTRRLAGKKFSQAPIQETN